MWIFFFFLFQSFLQSKNIQELILHLGLHHWLTHPFSQPSAFEISLLLLLLPNEGLTAVPPPSWEPPSFPHSEIFSRLSCCSLTGCLCCHVMDTLHWQHALPHPSWLQNSSVKDRIVDISGFVGYVFISAAIVWEQPWTILSIWAGMAAKCL